MKESGLGAWHASCAPLGKYAPFLKLANQKCSDKARVAIILAAIQTRRPMRFHSFTKISSSSSVLGFITLHSPTIARTLPAVLLEASLHQSTPPARPHDEENDARLNCKCLWTIPGSDSDTLWPENSLPAT